MKLDRDNFRHLTGFGRDMAGYVGTVFDKLHDGRFVVGDVNQIRIYYDKNKNMVHHRFAWTEGETYKDSVDIALRTDLQIIIEHDGFRETTAMPMFMVMSNACRNSYHLYAHMFLNDQDDADIDHAMYIGVTKRGWRTRWAEHLKAAESGSHCRFHKAIRQWHGVAKNVAHKIVGHASSEQKAMELEERLVAKNSLYPLGLNMIPGGYAGITYLRKIGAVGVNERVGVDDVQRIINRFFEHTSRKGIANPLAAANWLDPSYAEKVICAGPDRLKPQQIRDARFLSSLGQDADTIAERVGARNVDQVQRLLTGSTYSRIL